MTRLTLTVVLCALSSSTGCKLLDRNKDKDQAAPAPPEATPTKAPEAPPAAPAKVVVPTEGCEMPKDGIVRVDFTVKKGCTVDGHRNIVVRDNATLTVEPGAKVVMDSGHYISVDKGKLVAAGTEAEPIVFTSAAATKAPGDWVGIFFSDNTSAGTVLDHVRIEYAGSSRSGGKGAVTIQGRRPGARIAITSTVIEHSEQAAVWADAEKGAFAKFEQNKLDKNKVSLSVPAQMLGSVGAGNSFGQPLTTWGTVSDTVSWPAVDVPIIVERNVLVGDAGGAPTLTIAPKTVLKFSGGKYLDVGVRDGGTLVAREVTFTSANATPRPGDWSGIHLQRRATNVDLTGSTVEHAGKGSGAKAGVTVHAKGAELAGLKAGAMTFRDNEGAGVSTEDGVCTPFEAGSKSEGSPLCKKR